MSNEGVALKEVIETKKCEYCGGQGKVNVFLAEDNEEIKICPVCKGTGCSNEPSPTGKLPLWIGK